MHLVLGGAYQGKLTWAAERYALQPSDICDLATCDAAPDALPPARCYTHLEALSRHCRRTGVPSDALPRLLAADVVVAREVGSGVVPVDADERRWRECHGRLLRTLASEAEHVTRLFCGLPETLR